MECARRSTDKVHKAVISGRPITKPACQAPSYQQLQVDKYVDPSVSITIDNQHALAITIFTGPVVTTVQKERTVCETNLWQEHRCDSIG